MSASPPTAPIDVGGSVTPKPAHPRGTRVVSRIQALTRHGVSSRPHDVTGRPRHAVDAILLGFLAIVVTAAGSWIPSFWGDEAASVMSAQRPIPSLGVMVGTIDAVHGVYYLFLHGWIDMFGASEFSVRFPSALGAGAAVAGTVVLGRMLGSRRLGILAGIVLAVLPRLNFMGAEARSYALVTAIAVWASVLLMHLLRSRGSDRRNLLGWAGYAVVMVAGTYLFLYFAMLAVVHGLYLFAAARPGRLHRRWFGATTLAGVAALPIAVVAIQQRGQLAFLSTRQSITPSRVLVDQWFGWWPFAVVAWALILFAAFQALRALVRVRSGSPLIGFAMLWLVIPTALVIAVSVLVAPTYSLRYLSFSTPAAALLIAAGLERLPRRSFTVAGLAVIVALAVPAAVLQRGPFAKDGSDWRAASEYLGSVAKPGDAVVFDASVRNSRKPRLAFHLYPAGFAGLDDVQLRQSYISRDGLWDSTATVLEAAGSLALTQRVWLLQNVGSPDSVQQTDVHALNSLGFVTVSEHRIHRTDIVELERQVVG